jgi:membrane protein implicated in regulation of membrane protease activity
MALLWWHWVVLGLALIGVEMLVPTFYLIWFGLGALLVGLCTALYPLGFTAQVGLWTVASVAMVLLWFRYLKPKTKTLAGASDVRMVGEIGLMIREVAPFERGELRFQRPLAGSETWPCIADETIPVGTRVRVVALEGNILKVTKA